MLLVLSVWIVIGFLAASRPSNLLKSDSKVYLKIAENLRTHHVYSQDDAPPYQPETFRVPGYPLFLLPFEALFHPPTTAILIVQMIMALGTIWILLSAVRPWTDSRARNLVLLLWGLDIVYLFHMPMIMSESLFVFVLVLALTHVMQASEELSVRKTMGAALLLGATILIRPVSMFMPVVFSPVFWRRKRLILIFLASAYSVPALWVVRNYHVANMAQLTSQGGYDLLRYPASSVMALANGTTRAEEEERIRAEIDATVGGNWNSNAARSNAYGQAAVRIMKDHPLLTIKYHLFGVLRILAGHGLELPAEFFMSDENSFQANTTYGEAIKGAGTRALLKSFPVLIPLLILYLIVLGFVYIMYMWGLWKLFQQKMIAKGFLLLSGPLYLLAVSSHQGYHRYRIPLLPFLFAGAAMGISAWLTRMKKPMEG